MPCWWTLPVAYVIPFGHTLTLQEGEERTDVDFAWQVAPPGAVQGGIGGKVGFDTGEPGVDGVEVWLSSGSFLGRKGLMRTGLWLGFWTQVCLV